MGEVKSSVDSKISKGFVGQVESLKYLHTDSPNDEIVHILNVLIHDYKDRYSIE